MASEVEETAVEFHPNFYLYKTWLATQYDRWTILAPCVGKGKLFFPKKKADDTGRGYCMGCDFRGDCAEYAIVYNQHNGIWGGLLEDERAFVASEFRDIEQSIWSEEDRLRIRSLAEETFQQAIIS